MGQIHRLLDAEILHEAASLQDRVDALTYPTRVVVGVLAEDTHTAGAGPTKTFQRIDGRGLAGTVRAEEGEQFTRVDLEGDALDRLEVAVLLAQVTDDHHRFGGGLTGGLSGWCGIRRHVSRILEPDLGAQTPVSPKSCQKHTVLRLTNVMRPRHSRPLGAHPFERTEAASSRQGSCPWPVGDRRSTTPEQNFRNFVSYRVLGKLDLCYGSSFGEAPARIQAAGRTRSRETVSG